MTVEEIRAENAKKLSDWFDGKGKHPNGAIRWIIPYQLSSNCRDAKDHNFSEWGNAAGMTNG
jgi:hypothetical protein